MRSKLVKITRRQLGAKNLFFQAEELVFESFSNNEKDGEEAAIAHIKIRLKPPDRTTGCIYHRSVFLLKSI